MKLKELEALTACYKSYCNAGPCLIGGDGCELTEEYRKANEAEVEAFEATRKLAQTALRNALRAKGYRNESLED